LAVTAREKLIVSYHTGKRDYPNTEAFIADVEQRIAGRIQITTDGWQPYPEIIRRYLLPRLNYDVMQKIYSQHDPNNTNPNRRHSPPRCTEVRVDIVAGVPRKDRIGTSFVERTNLTVRHFNKRFARLGPGWSRKPGNHKAAISLFVAVFNFCKVHNTLGTTPAHGAEITDGPWTIDEVDRRGNNVLVYGSPTLKRVESINVYHPRIRGSGHLGLLPKCSTHHKRLHIRIVTPRVSLEIEGSGSRKPFGKHNSVIWATGPLGFTHAPDQQQQANQEDVLRQLYVERTDSSGVPRHR
jgi:IS1 family transposase